VLFCFITWRRWDENPDRSGGLGLETKPADSG